MTGPIYNFIKTYNITGTHACSNNHKLVLHVTVIFLYIVVHVAADVIWQQIR